jgi:hypothetical protein
VGKTLVNEVGSSAAEAIEKRLAKQNAPAAAHIVLIIILWLLLKLHILKLFMHRQTDRLAWEAIFGQKWTLSGFFTVSPKVVQKFFTIRQIYKLLVNLVFEPSG